MALPSITTNDFKGVYRLSRDTFELNDLEDYINRYYKEYLIKFVGAEMYQDIQTQTGLEAKYVDLFNGVIYQNRNIDRVLNCISLKDIIIRCIYFEFTRRVDLHTNTGFVRNKNENATDTARNEIASISINEYNRAIVDYNTSVFMFIDDYKHRVEDITGSSFLGGVWTITTDCTQYLENGDTVTIDNVKYTVSNVTANTSFDITADASLIISDMRYRYEPFDIARICQQNYSTY